MIDTFPLNIHSSVKSHHSSVNNSQSSMNSQQSSAIGLWYLSSGISYQSSIINHQSTVIIHKSSFITFQSSVISHQSSVDSQQLLWYNFWNKRYKLKKSFKKLILDHISQVCTRGHSKIQRPLLYINCSDWTLFTALCLFSWYLVTTDMLGSNDMRLVARLG